jgi:hypothetical protein
MAMNWRLPIDEILYGLTYTNELSDETVRWVAESAVHYTSLREGPEVYHEAIEASLASGEQLDNRGQLPQFNQVQLINFLRAVADKLDALRPWPEPNFRRIEDPEAWASFRQAVPIAFLEASIRQVADVLQTGFRPAGETQPGKHALILKLKTGETVALLGSYGRGEKVSLLADAADDPSAVLEHFISATNFPKDKVTLA